MLGQMQFTGEWRDYQARVLNEIDAYMGDQRLHIVAAPGAGKTILGLEVMRRLARPTLIFSPTRTIRDQWRQRLFPLFLPPVECWDDHISFDLDTPSTLTLTTYQALYSVWRGHDNADQQTSRFERLIEELKKSGPITLIVDECHHLRREWWNALFALRDALPDLFLVALTATPPYDAPYTEYARYEELCGPIDIEISIPELVRNGDLCPHQDHVHFSVPKSDELSLLQHRRQGLAQLVTTMLQDKELASWLQNHSWLTEPEQYEAQILEMPHFFSSLLIFLHAAKFDLPRKGLDLLGVSGGGVPTLSPYWLEIMLNGLLYENREQFPLDDARRKDLQNNLSAYGLIENRKVRLFESQDIFKLMAGSLAKFDSIKAIAEAEARNLSDRLRMVILSNHVRAADLPKCRAKDYTPAKIGVVPIFESLRRANIEGQPLAILTGSLIIVPESTTEALLDFSGSAGIDKCHLQFGKLAHCEGYLRLTAQGESHQRLVGLITEIFNKGHIRILIGTQALLGEGWDAPSINSLVLASNVGSFMLSNQMRGRAIRIDPSCPDKVSNIWHLSTVEPLETRFDGLNDFFSWGAKAGFARSADLDLLHRRFDMFEGINNGSGNAIENGLDRLCLPMLDGVENSNQKALALASDRARIRTSWASSLGNGDARSHVRKIAATNYAPSRLAWADTVQNLIYAAVSGGTFAAANAMREFGPGTNVYWLPMIFSGLWFLYSLPKLARSLVLFFRHGTLERSLGRVGQLLLEALSDRGLLSHYSAHYHVDVQRNLKGRYDVILMNATRADERVFLEAFAELLGPIQNPRYLLVRKSWLGRFRQTDYHNVPAIFAGKKEHAQFFHSLWMRYIGSSSLIFTRSAKGRKMLLKARANSFAGSFQRLVDRRSVWL